ncbi:hypothetical protein ESCO_001630 [Escovopsis weberi]|uniref:Uncharacterized protein n=1 Tax=Escovopsis weberi TaxID=150374 RepID=A0A0N0RU02_ESCWE|nr:hypothetical protein ESCO_001630 [Escovopsis weberi]
MPRFPLDDGEDDEIRSDSNCGQDEKREGLKAIGGGKDKDKDKDSSDGGSAPFNIDELLPASFRRGRFNEGLVPAGQDVLECIDSELNLDRLADVLDWLWLIGEPTPPRPLYHQLLLSREPTLTQRMDMHLVRTGDRVFLKPIPRFLFEPRFWAEYLACRPACSCSFSLKPASASSFDVFRGERPCTHRKLRKRAFGFLHSYTALVAHESDLDVAKDKRLVPAELTWQKWRIFVEELLTSDDIFRNVDARFLYGELRLTRLNAVYILKGRGFYMRFWTQPGDLFTSGLSIIASSTIYLAIVLTAMQLGVSVDPLRFNTSFISASYGFAVFSILGPLVFLAGVLIVFAGFLVYNMVQTVAYSKKRFREISASFEKS